MTEQMNAVKNSNNGITVKLFCPDTNFFIQCKKIENLNWSAITDADVVELIITRTVQEEIDGHKSSKKPRVQKKAREINSYFDMALDSGDFSTILRHEAPLVRIRLEDWPDNEYKPHPNLKLDKPDNAIINEMMAFNKSLPLDKQAVLLTGDTGARLTATKLNLLVVKIPDEFRLEGEDDEEGKIIAKLQAEIKSLVSKNPIIELKIVDPINRKDSFEVYEIVHEAVETPPENEIKNALELVKSVFPKRLKENNHTLENAYAMLTGLHKIREERIEEYNQKYDDWLSGVETILRNPINLVNRKYIPTFSIVVENTGNAPAENFCVEIDAIDSEIVIFSPMKMNEYRKEPSLKLPPKYPKGLMPGLQYLAMGQSPMPLRGLNLPSPHRKRDIHEFEWVRGAMKMSESMKYDVPEFRHKIEPDITEISALLTSGANITKVYKIRCRATASNTQPITEYVSVQKVIKIVPFLKVVKEALKEVKAQLEEDD